MVLKIGRVYTVGSQYILSHYYQEKIKFTSLLCDRKEVAVGSHLPTPKPAGSFIAFFTAPHSLPTPNDMDVFTEGGSQRVILTRCQGEVNPKMDLENWEEKMEGQKERLRSDKNFQKKFHWYCCPGQGPVLGSLPLRTAGGWKEMSKSLDSVLPQTWDVNPSSAMWTSYSISFGLSFLI